MGTIAREAFEEAKPRIPTHREKILNALRNAGEKGVTNIELAKVSQSWWARLQELYMQGYKVESTLIGEGIYRYVLTYEPEIPLPTKNKKASEILIQQIQDDYGGTISASQLTELLAENQFSIKRKQGYYKQ